MVHHHYLVSKIVKISWMEDTLCWVMSSPIGLQLEILMNNWHWHNQLCDRKTLQTWLELCVMKIDYHCNRAQSKNKFVSIDEFRCDTPIILTRIYKVPYIKTINLKFDHNHDIRNNILMSFNQHLMMCKATNFNVDATKLCTKNLYNATN